jgi:ArsR family transcriptional regulator, cadmium/lead-responsive transcriptional repressor
LAPSPAHFRSTLAAVVDPPEELRSLRLVHKALADVNRLRIVQRLAAGEATVSELIAQVGLSQQLVSWHLARLRIAGLVETRRAGRETVSRLVPEAFEAFAAYQQRVLGLSGAPGQVPAVGVAVDGGVAGPAALKEAAS